MVCRLQQGSLRPRAKAALLAISDLMAVSNEAVVRLPEDLTDDAEETTL
jgi:hypothetical protein